MEIQAFDRPADLSIWYPGHVAPMLDARRRFPSLRQAIEAAGAISDPSAQPWIVTEDGEVLAPNWIRAHLS